MQGLVGEANDKGLGAELWDGTGGPGRGPIAYDPSAGGRRILVLKFGSPDPRAPAVLLTGGIHARERIAVEIPYLAAEYLIKNYAPDPPGRGSEPQQAIRKLLMERRLFVAPMLNPDGHLLTFVENQSVLWRKNRRFLNPQSEFIQRHERYSFRQVEATDISAESVAYESLQYKHPESQEVRNICIPLKRLSGDSIRYTGVDLNRNFPDIRWGYETWAGGATASDNPVTSGHPKDDTYFGPTEASEPETKSLSELISHLATGPFSSIDFHSYGGYVLFPDATPIGSGARFLAQGMANLTNVGTTGYISGTHESQLYPAFASIMDYCASRPSPRFKASLSIECDPICAYGSNSKTPNSFHPNEDLIQLCFERNIRGILAFIECAGFPYEDGPLLRTGITNTIKKYSQWKVFGRGNQLPS